MTPVDALIEQFEELIPMVTPQLWERDSTTVYAVDWVPSAAVERGMFQANRMQCHVFYNGIAGGSPEEAESNAEYIALANPSNLRVLLDELKRLKKIERRQILDDLSRQEKAEGTYDLGSVSNQDASE